MPDPIRGAGYQLGTPSKCCPAPGFFDYLWHTAKKFLLMKFIIDPAPHDKMAESSQRFQPSCVKPNARTNLAANWSPVLLPKMSFLMIRSFFVYFSKVRKFQRRGLAFLESMQVVNLLFIVCNIVK